MTIATAIKTLLDEIAKLEERIIANDNTVQAATRKLGRYSSVVPDLYDHDLLRRLRANDDTITGVPDKQAYQPVEPVKAAAKPSSKRRGGTAKVTDDQLIATLTPRFQSADDVLTAIHEAGHPMKVANLYGRLKALAAQHPDRIVQRDKPRAWKLIGQAAFTKPVKSKAGASAPVPSPKPKPRKVKPSARKPNAYALYSKLVESVLTNRAKSITTIVADVRANGWRGAADAALTKRVLDGLVSIGVAVEPSRGRFARA